MFFFAVISLPLSLFHVRPSISSWLLERTSLGKTGVARRAACFAGRSSGGTCREGAAAVAGKHAVDPLFKARLGHSPL